MAGSNSTPWELLRSGDPAGLTGIYHDHADAVFGFAFRRTASISVAEDVVQATFTSLWRAASAGKLPALELPTPRPWLFRVAGNECRNQLRSARRRHALQERLHLREPRASVDLAEEASARVDDERRMSEVRRALESLPRAQREAIELVVWAESSTADAAYALGVAEGTVKSRVSRAKKRLGELLAAPDQEVIR